MINFIGTWYPLPLNVYVIMFHYGTYDTTDEG